LFKEFAFTLAGAVIVSGIIALTLSPMMCSKILSADIGEKRLVKIIDAFFSGLRKRYERVLDGALHFKPVTILFAFVVLLSCVFMFMTSQKELAPAEDQGALWAMATAPEYANINYTEKFTSYFRQHLEKYSAVDDTFTINGMNGANTSFTGIIMKPWGERKMSQAELMQKLQPELNAVPGMQVQMFGMPSLPIPGGSAPLNFVVDGTVPFATIYDVSQKLVDKAQASGLFLFVMNSLRFNKPELMININRAKAGQLGINMQSIASALANSLGGNYINRFSMQGRSYKVIPQVGRQFRLNPEELERIYIKTSNNDLVPLSAVASISYETAPNSLSHFQQLNASTIQGMMMPGTPPAQELPQELQSEINNLGEDEKSEAKQALMQIMKIVEQMVAEGATDEDVKQFLEQIGMSMEEFDMAVEMYVPQPVS
jgi:multidrug efflux pump